MTDDALHEEATRLCAAVNAHLRKQPSDNIGQTVARLAPGWNWIETTEPDDGSPTICLTEYVGDQR